MEFFPDRYPIDGLLLQWLKRAKLPTEAADLLRELNERIGDPDFAIGPSYLMNPRLAEPGGIERIWRHAILPLLQEHFFGTGIDVEDRFGVAALRRAVAGGAVPAPVGSAEEVAGGGGDDEAGVG